MTVTEIKSIIKECNKNHEIKWEVTKNTKSEIRLTNNYDKCVKFVIKIRESIVKVKDTHTYEGEFFIVGEDKYDDFKTVEEAVRASIKEAVKMFYYYY